MRKTLKKRSIQIEEKEKSWRKMDNKVLIQGFKKKLKFKIFIGLNLFLFSNLSR